MASAIRSPSSAADRTAAIGSLLHEGRQRLPARRTWPRVRESPMSRARPAASVKYRRAASASWAEHIPAGGQRPGHQGGVAQFPCHREDPLDFVMVLVPAEKREQQRLVRGSPHAGRRHVGVPGALVGQRGAQPGSAPPGCGPGSATGLQRRRQRHRQLGVRIVSRLHAKAARRLSISASAHSMRRSCSASSGPSSRAASAV